MLRIWTGTEFRRKRKLYNLIANQLFNEVPVGTWATRTIKVQNVGNVPFRALDVLKLDYVRTARAKGLKERQLEWRHAFRNALMPMVTLLGLTIPGLANCHSHAFHRGLRGRTQRGSGSFWTWREQMYALAERLTPDTYLTLASAVW